MDFPWQLKYKQEMVRSYDSGWHLMLIRGIVTKICISYTLIDLMSLETFMGVNSD